MWIVGEFDIHRESLVDAILDLRTDLIVSEIGKKRKAALRDAHCCSLRPRLLQM
jgi:hypothetical protein